MFDYAEKVMELREAAEKSMCGECGLNLAKGSTKKGILFSDAAGAIEELLAAVRSVVHCKDCEWWTKQEASIQGRCARLAIYPTGEFYCASGSKREPPEGVE